LTGLKSQLVQKADSQLAADALAALAQDFFARALVEDLSAADMFRVTTTSFMDVYNFDIRQLMKSCVHHLLPSGHLIPFDAYNIFYRTGLIALPSLNDTIGSSRPAPQIQTTFRSKSEVLSAAKCVEPVGRVL
jgi:hypothetical protein